VNCPKAETISQGTISYLRRSTFITAPKRRFVIFPKTSQHNTVPIVPVPTQHCQNANFIFSYLNTHSSKNRRNNSHFPQFSPHPSQIHSQFQTYQSTRLPPTNFTRPHAPPPRGRPRLPFHRHSRGNGHRQAARHGPAWWL